MHATRLIPLLLLLGGCTVLPDTSPVELPTHTYRLVAEAPATTQRQAAPQGVLQVSPIRAQAGADSEGIAYRRQAAALDYYSRSRWLNPPARLLQPLVVARLEADRGFSAVLSGNPQAQSDLRLDLELVELLHDFTVNPSVLRLELRASLIDQQTQQVLAQRRFRYHEAAVSASAQGGVEAANRAVAKWLDELSAFVAEAHRP